VPAVAGAAMVFCAIAHPEEFVDGLRAQGVAVAASHAWRDHHRFTDGDVTMLCELAAKGRAACFVTTEKDAGRLTQEQRTRLENTAPLLAAALTVRLQEPEAALAALEERLVQRGA
jgi:tetraacyldisaccharide 4'-kinase